MRISDWSSDVCSSDLVPQKADRRRFGAARAKGCGKSAPRVRQRKRHGKPHREQDRIGAARGLAPAGPGSGPVARVGCLRRAAMRSEEHTSELQSLMRISYAVFCLKKKKKIQYNGVVSEYLSLSIVYNTCNT